MRVASKEAGRAGPCLRLRAVLRRRRIAAIVAAAALAACRRDPLPEVQRGERDSAAGRRIFERKCASCHNVNGDGNTITASKFPYANLIDGKWRSDGSFEAIEKQVRVGHDPMPKFEGKLTDEEIRQVAAYVVALSRGAEARAAARAPTPP
jgi:mono/diheme cytochrome c family protein